VAVLADDEMIVHGDAERVGDLDNDVVVHGNPDRVLSDVGQLLVRGTLMI
jgi:hypothetical protein